MPIQTIQYMEHRLMIQIITGSTLGGAEYVGDHLYDLLTERGEEVTVNNAPNLLDIPNQGVWIIVTSTQGAGEYPDNIQEFIQQLQLTPPNMSQVKYAVIALGDSSYDTFCSAGKHAFSLLESIGSTPISPCLTIDVLDSPIPEEIAEKWLQDNLEKVINKQ